MRQSRNGNRNVRKAKTNGSAGNRSVRYFCIAAVLLILGILSIGAMRIMDKSSDDNTKASEQQNSMAIHLKNKYGQDFIVTNYRIEGSGLGVEGAVVADARPANDHDLLFRVSDRGNSTFADNYALTYWSQQGKELAEKEIKIQVPEVNTVSFTATGDINQNFHTMENYPYTGSIPDVRTVLKDHPGRLKVSFSAHSNTTTTEQEPSTEQLAQAYKVILYARNLGIENGTVGYTYSHPDYDESNSLGYKVPRYTILVNASNIDEIQQPEQLVQYFSDRKNKGE